MREDLQILQVEGLHIGFEGAPVVRGVSFTIDTAEIVALVGESGSGKTLSSLALNGLLPAAATWRADALAFRDAAGNWQDLGTAATALRGVEIGMVFQDPGAALNPLETCGYQVAEALVLRRGMSAPAARAEALQWLSRVGLEDPERIFRAYPHELSGGQKQRVMIAAAMAPRPRLLLADEPTTSLDVTVQKQILELLRGICRQSGTAVLFISHDLNLVRALADRVLVMRHGEVIEQGTAAEVFDRPRQAYTRALLQCRPGLLDRPHRLPVLADFTPEEAATPPQRPAFVAGTSAGNPASGQHPFLEVQGLSVAFPLRRRHLFEKRRWLRAVDDLSFRVEAGQTLGIAGESGSGKTTLARVLLGLVRPIAGEVYLQGENVLSADLQRWGALRRQMQLIFQDPFTSLNPRIPVGEAILEPLRYHCIGDSDAERRERVAGVLQRVGLSPGDMNRLPEEFSGGQRQRIGIARAIALHPRFLVCDESVSSLDVSIQAQTLNLLRDLQEELGLTCIFISHDLSVIRFMSDQVLVMKGGCAVEYGPAEEVLLQPTHPYTRILLESVPGKG
jgi:peptide/nickel transport system ATP-binding protein